MKLEQQVSVDRSVAEIDGIGLRPASVVMAPERARAACPNALSFSRSFLRRMQREQWRIDTVRLELDAEGRGEGLYRVTAGDWEFHFLAISDVFPADQKIDRSFGINWDVSAAICQGAWTAEREALLREEIPKQYSGRYDSETLCFCRGNRSERLFDHVVDSLSDGGQPDAALLATVGYILRSTAFAGNGLFGMKPFEAFGPAHPLAATYHVQMLSAYMLRHFVFDLVDGMAAARSSRAVKLDRRLKRYLGIGNSAGLGLIPFLANHPQIVHRWCLTNERALAAAKQRVAGSAAPYLDLLAKAERYLREDPRDGNGIFASYAQLAAEVATVSERIGALSNRAGRSWATVLDAALRDLHPETVEIACSLLLELYPDIVERFEGDLTVAERIEIDPAMTVGTLRSAVRSTYGWLIPDGERRPEDVAFFWYYPVEAPDEPRRGLRGRAPDYEFESRMDVPLRLDALLRVLKDTPDDGLVAALVGRHPELRAIVARIQSVAGLDYAELRDNYLATSFTPYAACRFVLAFYGLEKYDPRPPRSTKASLLQGAPLADEFADTAGDWPFPLIPDLGQRAQPAVPTLVPLRVIEGAEISVGRVQELAKQKTVAARSADIGMFPLEYRRLLTKAALSSGYPLGVAEFLARMAQLCATLRLCRLEDVLDEIGAKQNAESALATAPAAFDMACVQAQRRRSGIADIRTSRSSTLLGALATLAAQRDLIGIVADCSAGKLFASGPDPAGLWFVEITACSAAWMRDAVDRLHDGDAMPAALLRMVEPNATATHWRAKEIKAAEDAMHQHGLRITSAQFERMLALAKRTLVPEAAEQQIVPR